MKPMKFAFVKPKMKNHHFQEIIKKRLQIDYRNSVKHNELYQRMNTRIQRQNKDCIEKYNCEISIISFEDLNNYEAGNNSKKNAEWFKGKIVKRTFEIL
jgi:hypothetical protein